VKSEELSIVCVSSNSPSSLPLPQTLQLSSFQFTRFPAPSPSYSLSLYCQMEEDIDREVSERRARCYRWPASPPIAHQAHLCHRRYSAPAYQIRSFSASFSFHLHSLFSRRRLGEDIDKKVLRG